MINLHTHTYRCKHSSGDIDDYVKTALNANVTELGFSDHTPLPDNRWFSVRMSCDEADGYFSAIEVAKEKYASSVILYKSLECDWDSGYKNFFVEIREKYGCDYLIGAVHWYPYKGDWYSAFEIRDKEQLYAYIRHYIEAISSGIFEIMAHPDVFGCMYAWDKYAEQLGKEIINAALKSKVFLEINANGFRKGIISDTRGKLRYRYPLPEFWALYSELSDWPVVCNSDAHHPDEIVSKIQNCMNLASQYNLIVKMKWAKK